MAKDLIIIVLGALVALVPFLGFPNRWDTVIFVVSGISIVVLMFMLRRDILNHAANGVTQRHEDAFAESDVHRVEGVVAPASHLKKHLEGDLESEENGKENA